MKDPVSSLEALQTMRERQLITEAEYQDRRAAILERVAPSAPTATPPANRSAGMSRRMKVMWAIVAVFALGVFGNLLGKAPSGQPDATSSATPTIVATATTLAIPTATKPSAALGDRESAVAYFEGLGFSGGENTLTDGTPRWLGRRSSDSASVEAIGPATAITRVSITMVWREGRTEAVSADLGDFADHFAPTGGRAFLAGAFSKYDGTTDVDEQARLGDRLISLTSLTATDGAIFLVQVSTD